MKINILVAGPGTGKTRQIINKVSSISDYDNLLVISFTNATVKQLYTDLTQIAGIELPEKKCCTLHSLALILASIEKQYVLTDKELKLIQRDSVCIKTGYEILCQTLKCKDFNQIIRSAIEFIKINPVLARERLGGIKLLLIDEFQDFNPLEQELLVQLSTISEETWIIGDDDQAIYDFKDANPQGIIDLHNNPQHDKITHANICYRCPDIVVEHAKKLIENNKNRLTKEWKTAGNDGFLKVAQFLTKELEQSAIYRKIEEIVKNDKDASILILYPNDIALYNFDKYLEKNNIPYKKHQKKLKDYIKLRHYLYLIQNNNIFLHSRLLLNLDVQQTIKFYSVIDKFKDKISTISDFIGYLKEETKIFIAMQSLINSMNTYKKKGLIEFMKENGMVSIADEFRDDVEIENSIMQVEKIIEEHVEVEANGINIMSIHKSKGLQADYVFVMGVTDGVLPMIRKGTTLEGQRRLMYVALTRCKKGIYLSTAINWKMEEGLVHKVAKGKFRYNYRNKMYEGSTSPFITEMGYKVDISF